MAGKTGRGGRKQNGVSNNPSLQAIRQYREWVGVEADRPLFAWANRYPYLHAARSKPSGESGKKRAAEARGMCACCCDERP